ncbi:50S ribosomal protein L3, partial [Francisella tularensis subsp. holarctica]|nr:50S ribosomal protein L3 [Francisella tularensis subsp. holarctica]
MSLGLVCRKCGMTRIFTEDGLSIPVTVVQVEPNKFTQVKTVEKEGYNGIQVTRGFKKRSNVNKPLAGHYA